VEGGDVIRILVVEDESKMRRVLCDFLVSEGYATTAAADGESGLEKALAEPPDLILLDIMLPKKSGYDLCRELRAKGRHTPIIMLTARSEETDKVLGLELGADDYVTKPVGLTELNARIRAVLRRVNGSRPDGEIEHYTLGEVELDFKLFEVRRKRKLFPLSTMEVALLRHLIRHRGEVLSRERLLNDVWGYDSFPTTRTIDMHIVNLRKKIERNPARPQHLLTVHGTGYRLSD
jgi:DNA-binding response OmpR family regulator